MRSDTLVAMTAWSQGGHAWSATWRARIIALAIVAGAGCGDDGPPTNFGRRAVPAPRDGSGTPSGAPLLPLASGARWELPNRHVSVVDVSDRFGEPAWTLAGSAPTLLGDGGLSYDGLPAAWDLAPSAQGLMALAVDGEPLPTPALVVPAVVRHGMRWQIGDGRGFGWGLVSGGTTVDTVYGPTRVWTVHVVLEEPRSVELVWDLAEGYGFYVGVKQAVVPAASPPRVAPMPALALTPAMTPGSTLTGASAVSIGGVQGWDPAATGMQLRIGTRLVGASDQAFLTSCFGDGAGFVVDGDGNPSQPPTSASCWDGAAVTADATARYALTADAHNRPESIAGWLPERDRAVGLRYTPETDSLDRVQLMAVGTGVEVQPARPLGFFGDDWAAFADRDHGLLAPRLIAAGPIDARATSTVAPVLLQRAGAIAIGDYRVRETAGAPGAPTAVEPTFERLRDALPDALPLAVSYVGGARRVLRTTPDGAITELLTDGGRVLTRGLGRATIPDGYRAIGATIDASGTLLVVTTQHALELTGPTAYNPNVNTGFVFRDRSTTQVSRATAVPGPPTTATAELGVLVTRSDRDLRVCVPPGAPRPGLTGWTLGATAAAVTALPAGDRCIVLLRPPSDTSDAFVARGTLDGLGVTTVAAGPTAARAYAVGGDDDPPANDGMPPGWTPDRAGAGGWRLDETTATSAACPAGPCRWLRWLGRDGHEEARLVAATRGDVILMPNGGALVVDGATVSFEPAGLGAAATVRALAPPPAIGLPPHAPSTVVEFWITGATLDATWRCAATNRVQTQGTLALDGLSWLEGLACRRGDGRVASTQRCGRGLVSPALEEVQADGVFHGVVDFVESINSMSRVSARVGVMWDPATDTCSVEPEALDTAGVARQRAVAPDGVTFELETHELPTSAQAWQLFRHQPRAGGRELVDAGTTPGIPPPVLVAGRDVLAVVGETTVRRVPRTSPMTCSCGLGALCDAGVCACPDGTTGDPTRAPEQGGCLAPPGAMAAPAPSCAAMPALPPVDQQIWVDPDGRGGPFIPRPVTCDADGTTRPDLDPIWVPNFVLYLAGTELHGAFWVDSTTHDVVVLDGLERSRDLDGFDLNQAPSPPAPGRFTLIPWPDLTVEDGLRTQRWRRTPTQPLRVQRDAAGVISVVENGATVYQRATHTLGMTRIQLRTAYEVGWRGDDCAHAVDPWPSSPALCTCAPIDCAGRGATCGPIDDGCGRTEQCGACGNGFACAENACACVPDETEALSTNPTLTVGVVGGPWAPSFPASLDSPADVDSYRATRTVASGEPPTAYAAQRVGPAGGTTALVLEVRPAAGCTTTCRFGAIAGVGAAFGGVSCTAGASQQSVIAEVDCGGAARTDTLAVTVSPTVWDPSCMNYEISLNRFN